MIPTANTSYCSLFLFIVLLHISFHAYLFIQNDLGLCGPNNIDWIKRVLGPICLDLSKPFYWRIVFCGRTVFCCRFVFCCRLLSLALLSLDLSCSSIFFVGLWALLFIGLSSSWAFGYGFAKLGINSNHRIFRLSSASLHQCIHKAKQLALEYFYIFSTLLCSYKN